MTILIIWKGAAWTWAKCLIENGGKSMKRIICAVFALLLVGVMAYHAGKNHVILDSEMFIVELPERNEYGGFDESEITVYLDIDGDIHEYGCNIG